MSTASKVAAWAAAGCLSALVAGTAAAAEISVTSTQGPMPQVMGALIPVFERASGNKVTIKFQAAPQTINELKAGAGTDLLIMDEETIGDFVKDGLIATGGSSKVMLSRVGLAVRAGAPKPDIGTADALKAALIAAKSVAYSQGASGRHFTTVIARLGLTDTLKPKTVIVQGKPVGGVDRISQTQQNEANHRRQRIIRCPRSGWPLGRDGEFPGCAHGGLLAL